MPTGLKYLPSAALLLSLTSAASPNAHPPKAPAANQARLAENYGKLPLSFEANHGQTDPSVKFLSRGSGYSLYLTDSTAIFSLPPDKSGRAEVIQMRLADANPQPKATGAGQLPGVANYFLGKEPAQWRTAIPTYAKVQYTAVYPGIDLVYYGNRQQLEYDFVLSPSASPGQIRLVFSGQERINLNADGDLILHGHSGQATLHKPAVYQEINGRRQPIGGTFKLARNTVSFRIGPYNHAKPLVIDPTLAYSTFLGGGGPCDIYTDPNSAGCLQQTSGNAVAVDGDGNVYITGQTFAWNFPTSPNALQTVNHQQLPTSYPRGNGTAFVTKLNSSGTALVYSTYLGGSNPNYDQELGNGIAVDADGNAYVTGITASRDFPTTAHAFLTVNKPAESANGLYTGFVSKLNASGTSLVYSTFLGGTTWDQLNSIAIDPEGNAYVTGQTGSKDFPTTPGAFEPSAKTDACTAGMYYAGFVSKVAAAGDSLVYSTFLAGSQGDIGNAIAVDKSGEAYVGGGTSSTDFPTTDGAFQTQNFARSCASETGFVSKLNASGSALVYSSYLGGSAGEEVLSLAVGPNNNAYVTGVTGSVDFPTTPGAFQPQDDAIADYGYSNDVNAFVTQFNTAGSALIYSTFLGGTGAVGNVDVGGDTGNGIAVDPSGNAYVTGNAESLDFPITEDAFQKVNLIGEAAFVVKLNPAGDGLLYSTFLAGNQGDYGSAIAVDAEGSAYTVGITDSPDFPVTTGAFQNQANSFGDAFVAKFNLASESTLQPTETVVTSSANPQAPGNAVTFSIQVTPRSGNRIPTGKTRIAIDGIPALPQALDSTGRSTYAVASLGNSWLPGGHEIVATYLGDYNYSPSSNNVIQTVAAVFTLAMTPSSLYLNSATSANASIVVTQVFGTGKNAEGLLGIGTVSFACSGLPAGVSCSFSPATIEPLNGGSASTTITVSAGAIAKSSEPAAIPSLPIVCAGIAFGWVRRKRKLAASWPRVASIAAIGFTLFAGCSGGGTGGGSTPNPTSYSGTVTATSSSLATGVQVVRTVNFTAIVQQ